MNTCKICGRTFEINRNDADFYRKIAVPAEPVFCHECIKRQLMCWRNERTLYASKCSMCRNDMISCYSPNSPFTVYCANCWWSDKFNPTKHGRDFDFGRPFFEQFWKLTNDVPLGNLIISASENSDYSNYACSNKNCYMVTASDENQDSFYAQNSNGNRDVCDVLFVTKSELMYDSLDCVNCYMCLYCQNLKNCNFCYFCRDCIGISDCIGCTGLQNAKHCVFNKQYTKEEYDKLKKDIDFGSYKTFIKTARAFDEIKKNQPRAFIGNLNSEGCRGQFIINSKNCVDCADMYECRDCFYSSFGYKTKDAYDIYGAPGCEFVYQSVGAVESYNVQFCALVWPGSSDVYYSFLTRTAKNCLGCVSLHRNEFCILNKQYSASDYKTVFEKIKRHMTATGEWGKFFPMKYSPWAYNETVANDFAMLSKEKAQDLGARWQDKMPATRGKETVKTGDILDNIKDAPAAIINEIFVCECGRNFRVIEQELKFYKKLGISLPRQCHDCRYKKRINLHNLKSTPL